MRIYESQGIIGLVKAASRYARYHVHAPEWYWKMQSRNAIRDMRVLSASDPDSLVKYVFDGYNGLLRPVQKRSEILQLVRIVQERRPKVVMEIGTATGGTLFLLARSAAEDAHIISIDLPGGRFGGGYPMWKTQLYRAFATPSQWIQPLRLNSHMASTRSIVNTMAGDGIDLLFIDGDHTYEGVKKDFEMYSPLVNKGGLIAFHDIVEHPRSTGCEVSRYWNEVKQGRQYTEIVEDWYQGSCGIGVLLV